MIVKNEMNVLPIALKATIPGTKRTSDQSRSPMRRSAGAAENSAIFHPPAKLNSGPLIDKNYRQCVYLENSFVVVLVHFLYCLHLILYFTSCFIYTYIILIMSSLHYLMILIKNVLRLIAYVIRVSYCFIHVFIAAFALIKRFLITSFFKSFYSTHFNCNMCFASIKHCFIHV